MEAKLGTTAPGCSWRSSIFVLSLCCQEAVEIVGRLFKWVHGRCFCSGTSGLPFSVFLLTFRTICFAHTISCHFKCPNLADTMQVHAFLRKQVFSPWSKFPVVALVVEGVFAVIHIVQQSLECHCRENFEVTEESVHDLFAILQVNSLVCYGLVSQCFKKASREENCIRIRLHHPIVVFVFAIVFHSFPDFIIYQRVHPCALDFPFGKICLSWNCDLRGEDFWRAWRDPCACVAIDIPALAAENAGTNMKLGSYQVQLCVFLGGACV